MSFTLPLTKPITSSIASETYLARRWLPFWLHYGIKQEQQTQHHREEHGVNIDCPEVAGGLCGSTSENVRRSS